MSAFIEKLWEKFRENTIKLQMINKELNVNSLSEYIDEVSKPTPELMTWFDEHIDINNEMIDYYKKELIKAQKSIDACQSRINSASNLLEKMWDKYRNQSQIKWQNKDIR